MQIESAQMKTHHTHLHQKIDHFLANIETPKVESVSEYKGWVFFVEIDQVLIDMTQLQSQLKTELLKTFGANEGRKIWASYGEFKRIKHLRQLPQILGGLFKKHFRDHPRSRMQFMLDNFDFSVCKVSKFKKVINYLNSQGKVCILTQGNTFFQEQKLAAIEIEEHSELVEIYSHKKNHLRHLFNKFNEYQPVFIDYQQDFLEWVKQLHPDVLTILITTRADDSNNSAELIDLRFKHIDEILEYVFE